MKQPPAYEVAIKRFDQVIKQQKEFWCPICDTWMPQDRCETAAGHPFMDHATKKFSVIVFGVCTKCAEVRAKGVDLGDAARMAITERMARRAAAGQAEQTDPRKKYVIVKDGMTETPQPRF